MVSTILNYKAADSVAYIDHSKGIHVITKLSPAQQVKGQQSEPASANNTTEFSPTNRLKHLGIKAQGKSKEVIPTYFFSKSLGGASR